MGGNINNSKKKNNLKTNQHSDNVPVFLLNSEAKDMYTLANGLLFGVINSCIEALLHI